MKNKLIMSMVASMLMILPVSSLRADHSDYADHVDSEDYLRQTTRNQSYQEGRSRLDEMKAILEEKIGLLRNEDNMQDYQQNKSFDDSYNEALEDFIDAAEAFSNDPRDPDISRAHLEAFIKLQKGAREVWAEANQLKKAIERFNREYDDMGSYPEWDTLYTSMHLNSNGTPVVELESGTLIDLHFDESDLSDAVSPSEDRSPVVSRRNPLEALLGDDEEDHETPPQESAPTCSVSEPSGLETFVAYLGPLVGIGLAGWSAYEASEHADDMRKMGERLIVGSAERGESPYMYAGLLRGAFNSNPFGFLGDALAPSMEAIQWLYNGRYMRNGAYMPGSEFQSRRQMQMLMQYLANRNGRQDTQSTSTTQHRVEFRRQIDAFNNFGNMIPDVKDQIAGFRNALDTMNQQVWGGVSQREVSEMMTAMTNVNQKMQAGLAVSAKLKELLDGMEQLVDQAEEGVNTGNAVVSGDGGVTTTIERTTSDRSQSQQQFQSAGPQGRPQFPGFPQTGGGVSGRFRFAPN